MYFSHDPVFYINIVTSGGFIKREMTIMAPILNSKII